MEFMFFLGACIGCYIAGAWTWPHIREKVVLGVDGEIAHLRERINNLLTKKSQ
jgi:hypothetical protein